MKRVELIIEIEASINFHLCLTIEEQLNLLPRIFGDYWLARMDRGDASKSVIRKYLVMDNLFFQDHLRDFIKGAIKNNHEASKIYK